MLNAEYDDRKDVLYMYYEYNPYIGYGEDRSFQLPPLFPGGSGGGIPGGQTFPGAPGGQGTYPPFIPGGGPGPYIPGGIPGTIPGTATGVPAQLAQGNLPTLLSAYPRPVGQPPAEMIFLYNLIKSSPVCFRSSFSNSRRISLKLCNLHRRVQQHLEITKNVHCPTFATTDGPLSSHTMMCT
ncbi:hypothetical protein P9222_24715 [Paenibacillus amylolyticus]|nr:hypothetical protein [Paenibacillus amylolyticus]WFR61584.1 hypothetical protein P9222_24715 [Paenibacillus amylolyticus]